MPIVIQKKIPEGGLDQVADLAAYPFVNLMLHRNQEDQESLFPARALCMAPNSKGFLDWLGRPLGIAHDLEASPGMWWLQDTDHGLDWVIYSDSHRANAWKGGQLCVGAMDGSSIKLSHPGVVAMQRVVARAWGMPPPNLNTIMFCEWFNHRAAHRKIAQLHTLQSITKSPRP